MEANIIVSLLGIVISAIVAYYTSTNVFARKYHEGKIRIFDLTHRYFYVMYNSFDHRTRELKTDKESTDIYIFGIQSIYDDLQSLMENPFMHTIIKKNLYLSSLPYRLGCAIVGSKEQQEPCITKELIDLFIKLFTMTSDLYKEDEWKTNEELKDLKHNVNEFKKITIKSN